MAVPITSMACWACGEGLALVGAAPEEEQPDAST